jgi:predicted Ser/Thr protein kinase
MDGTPYLAFKFFLPSNMKHIVLSDTAFRQDRGFIIQNIEWNDNDLVNILRRRISALINPDDGIRDQTITNFDALCVPELKFAIEHDLAKNANGNPRYLMNLCAQMVTAHCLREIENQDDIYQLNRGDFDYALERVKALYQRIALAQNFQEGEVLVKRYRVEEIMDTMHSRVIKAWDESLMRFVAIKFPRVNLSKLNEKKIDRIFNNLRTEAGILAKLQHPNIGKVYDILEEPFGIVMEWVDGQPIQDLLDKKERLSVYDIILVGMEVADALAYAHYEGVIHRDIKPKNIILTTHRKPKLIDFDIARDELLDTVARREDGSGFLVGTPAYSSPEQLAQIEGVSRTEIGPASDIFSLGVVLYEMLSFKIPKAFPKIDNNIPEPLYRILLGMLDGKPSNRPTAIDLKDDLAKLYQTKD